MKQFVAFVKKEFFHILRDTRTMLILLVMPIVMIVIFGFAISTEIRNINVGILAPERSEEISEITRKIEASDYFTVTEIISNPTEIDILMRKGVIDVAVVFDNNFDNQKNVQFAIDASDPTTATSEMYYLTALLQDFYIADDVKMPIQTTTHMLYNPQMKSSYNFVPGIMGQILLLICAMMTSVAIVREKETGTMEVLLASPVRPLLIIAAKMIPYFTVSLVNFLTILGLSYTVLGIPVTESLGSLVLISVVFLLLSLSLGLLISSLVETQLAAMFGSLLGLFVPVLLMSGMIFPIENMPDVLQVISNIVPARWYIDAMKKLMIQQLPFEFIVKELIILSSMTVFLLGLSLKKFKKRLE